MPLSPEEVGARIVTARDEKKPKPWSQFDLALAMGVSPSTIYRWEKGKLPSMNELIRLADVLDQQISYFAEPPEHQAQVADLHDRLVELADGVARAREAMVEALASIDVRLSQIEERLAAQEALGQAHP